MNQCFDQIKEKFLNAILANNQAEVNKMASEFVMNYNDDWFIDKIIVEIMESVGEKWEKRELSLAELYFISLTCEQIVTRYYKTEKASTLNHERPLEIGILTYKDSHFMGKQLLKLSLKSQSIKYYEFENYCEDLELLIKIGELKLKYIFVSVLMYDSAIKLNHLIVQAKEIYPGIVFIVGGAPFRLDKTLAERIGADYSKPTVTEAIRLYKNLKEDLNE